MSNGGKPPKEDERISLHGHDPEAVLKALLKVEPEAEPVEDDPAPPHGDPLRKDKGEQADT
jgi:hypothetical protein